MKQKTASTSQTHSYRLFAWTGPAILALALIGGCSPAFGFGDSQEAAKLAAVRADEVTLGAALHHFRIDCDRYPTTNEGLQALRICPPHLEKKWRGPYISKGVPNDPWGHAYAYRAPGKNGERSVSIMSGGPSGNPFGKTAIVFTM